MTPNELKEAIMVLARKGLGIREISRTMKISRNSVRRTLRGETTEDKEPRSRYEALKPLILELYHRFEGNGVRIQEVLASHGESIPYSTLTRLIRELFLRDKGSRRAGRYEFGPGAEFQHDTSPHKVIIGDKVLQAQCAGLVLACSRKLFIQYYPAFTRFEARVFLTEAFAFMGGTCPRCTIDNTSVLIVNGTGPDAEMAPEVEMFGRIFGVKFIPHAVKDPDRKARIERNFSYVEGNFLAGRTFTDWLDINARARAWCVEVANRKPKRSLGMSPDEAYLVERPHLQPLPPYIPPAYLPLDRVVDLEGYVVVDTNRYSVPERLIGKQVEIHKEWERIKVFFKDQQVADHPRMIGKCKGRLTAKGHHPPLTRKRAYWGPSQEETILRGHCPVLNRYIDELKKRAPGRALRQLRALLDLKRTYPPEAFAAAINQAANYGLYDLHRLERMILASVAGNFFNLQREDD